MPSVLYGWVNRIITFCAGILVKARQPEGKRAAMATVGLPYNLILACTEIQAQICRFSRD